MAIIHDFVEEVAADADVLAEKHKRARTLARAVTDNASRIAALNACHTYISLAKATLVTEAQPKGSALAANAVGMLGTMFDLAERNLTSARKDPDSVAALHMVESTAELLKPFFAAKDRRNYDRRSFEQLLKWHSPQYRAG